MGKVLKLPDNLIGKKDHFRLERYAAYEIARGRAVRYLWARDEKGSPVFEIYRGYLQEELAVRIRRDRERDLFLAEDKRGFRIASGGLEQVMAALDRKLAVA